MRTNVLGIGGLLVLVVAGGHSSAAQFARVSPHETVSATIGGADISIAYGRPSMRGRAIMGRLVPYGRVWCPGADEATELATSKTLRIGDLTLKPGRYTLWMVPSSEEWTLVVSTAVDVFHTQYSPRFDLARVALEKREVTPPVEQLTFVLGNGSTGSEGTIAMTWETTSVSIRFSVVE